MEKMENEYRMLFKEVSPSMVIVEHVGRVGYFCIGSVLHSEGETTFILTQSRIIDPAEKLSIYFSNGCKQSATLLAKLGEENLCILMTDFHPKCKAIQFCEDEIDHTYVGTIAPANRSSVYNLRGFIIRKPCEVGSYKHQSLIKGGKDYFTFTSQYGGRSPNGVSRLFSAPVFNLRGQSLGIAIDDMEFKEWPKKKDGKIFHEELYDRYGFLLKVGMTVKRLKELLRDFWGFVERIKVDGTASSSPRAQEGQSPSLPPKKGSPSKKVRSPSPPPTKASPPRKASPPAESAVLCIDHLSRNVNEAHLKEIFGNFGEIVNVELSMGQTVNPPHGYGYIEFKKRADAEKALLYMDGGQIDGNVVKLGFTLQPCQRAASPMKAPPPPPKRDAPPIEKGVSNAEKDAQLRPRESSPRRKPASPPRKRSPNRRAESPRRPPDPSPRRRPDSPPIRRRPDPSPVRRGGTPPRRRPLSPVRRRSPSPPPRRHRSPMRPSPRRGRGSPSPRRRSPGPLRRRSPPPRRLRSPPRRPPPPRRYSRSPPPRRPLRSRSRSISPRSSPPPRWLRSPPRRTPPPRRYSRSPPCRPLHSRSRSISPRRGRGLPLRCGRSDSSYSRSPTPLPRKGPRRISRSRSPRRGRNISSDSRSNSSPSPRRGR